MGKKGRFLSGRTWGLIKGPALGVWRRGSSENAIMADTHRRWRLRGVHECEIIVKEAWFRRRA